MISLELFLTVHEQRVSSFLMNILLLLTPLMEPVLKYIPVPVLYGIFILALLRTFKDIQFAKRFLMLFMPKRKQPDLIYLRQVPLISANVFTVVQVFCTIILWVVRASEAAIVFPVVMLLIHVVRYLLEYILPLRDILVLDEPVRKVARRWRKHKGGDHLLSDMEGGKLLSDETIHEDVIYDHNKVTERVNIAEELSKTAAWKQLMKDELSNSPISNSPKLERQTSSKRRRKSRRKSAGDMPREHTSTFLLDQTDSQFKRKDSQIEKSPLHQESENSNEPILSNDRNAQTDRSLSNDRKELKERKISKDRSGSGRKRKKSRDHSVKEHHKHEHHRKHEHELVQKIPVEEPLPPWEQPYHSPPRKDFGLLKIPEDDCSVDPACSRSESPPSDQLDSNVDLKGSHTPPPLENGINYKNSSSNIVDSLAEENSSDNNITSNYIRPSPDESKSRDASSEEEN